MAKVTGTLQDIGMQAMTGRRARIVFTPDQASVRGGFVIPTAPVYAEVGQNGIFSAELQPSMATNPPTPLKVAIEWQEPDGKITPVDYPNWRLVVREEGGNFGQQMAMVGGGVVSVKPDRADIDESVNRILPITLSGNASIIEAGRLAALQAMANADLLVGSEHRSPKTGQDDAFRVQDVEGKVAFGVNPDSTVGIGDTLFRASDANRVVDRDGFVAFEITPGGRTYIYDPVFPNGIEGGASADPVDTLHVIPMVGQSNGSGRAVPDATDTADRRIFQYGATRRRLEAATIPLDMHDTSSGMSPATTFARNYLKMQPSNVGVLLVPAAHGGTGFTSASNTLTWTVNAASAPEYDLPAKAVAQTLAAIEAARAAGYAVSLEGMLWHQGESNGSMSTAVYASALDRLISYFRSSLAAPRLPFVVGQMVPDGIDKSEGRQGVDQAHSQTPVRVAHTGFAPALRGGHNTGDTTHMNRDGVVYMGRTMLAAYWHAVGNVLTAPPAPVANLKATKAGTAVTASWMAPPANLTQSAVFNLNTGGNKHVWSAPQAHITGYKVEAKAGSAAWVTVKRDWAPAITETFTAPAGTTQVRVTAMNGSTESAPVTVTAIGA